MLFSSLIFLFLFLPITIGLYLLAPRIGKNTVLLLASLLFYAWGGFSYLIVLVVSILLNHNIALALNGAEGKNKKGWLTAGVILNVAILASFKYIDFAVENLNALIAFSGLDLRIDQPNVTLPLGISFFTFQQMSMLWDVYRDPEKRKLRLTDTALYVSLFPQLVAGPIVRYGHIINQIRERVTDAEMFRSGVQRFVLGLFRKVVIANNLAVLADQIFAMDPSRLNPALAWTGITVFAIQVYNDFAGYSDMAIGLGRIFGFRIQENFDFPYISRSIQEVWRRWHISLSSWFKDYVYIPMGGNRLGEKRTYINLFTVFLLTGFWHGATWNFILWGLIHGVFLTIERLGWKKQLDRMPKLMAWSYTAFVWLVTLTFFRLRYFSETMAYLAAMFGLNGEGELNPIDLLDREYVVLIIIGMLGSSTLFLRLKKHGQTWIEASSSVMKMAVEIATVTVMIGILTASAMFINAGSFDPFVYFRF